MKGLVRAILDFFFGRNNPEAKLRRALRRLGKDIGHSRYRSYYRPKNGEVLGDFAKFVYSIYRVISPIQELLRSAEKSQSLRDIVVESFLDPWNLELHSGLSKERIEQRSLTTKAEELAKELKQEYQSLMDSIDEAETLRIESCYSSILDFSRFVGFDFYFLLKKFGFTLAEHSFSGSPKFSPVRGDYIIKELEDLIDVLYPMDSDQDWNQIFQILKEYRPPIGAFKTDDWYRTLNRIREIRRSGILEMMVRHISQDMSYLYKTSKPQNHVMDNWRRNEKKIIDETISKISSDTMSFQKDELVKAVFGTEPSPGTQFYSPKGGEKFIRKRFSGFVLAAPLSYLAAFLRDQFNTSFTILSDVIVINGQGSPANLSTPLTDAIQSISDTLDDIIALDNSLSMDSSLSKTLETSLMRSDSDPVHAHLVEASLDRINGQALTLIRKTLEELQALAQILKAAIDDYQSMVHRLIMNWHELDSLYGQNLGQAMTDFYKKIFSLTDLMQLYLPDSGTTP